MPIQRVALIYDDRPRPETTGVYCLRALRELVQVEHVRPDDLGRAAQGGFDLYLNIDDGHEYRLPPALRPCAWWVIDTHMNLDWDLRKAPDFDLVFAAQRPGAEALTAAGAAQAAWLPLACDPQVHAKHDVPKQYDLCFVGNLIPGPRAELVGLLQRHFAGVFVDRLYFEDMARAYSASRLVFNRSIRDDVNMRVFEALACGSLLLTNDLPEAGQADLFRDGQHLATYRDADELLDKARFYLAREGVRERVAAAGWAEVRAKHTYRHRMEAVLAAAERHLGRASAAVPSPVSAPAGQSVPVTVADARDPTYFDFARPELLALVPSSARDVLDVGCGAGRLGATLKARQPARVTGLEYDPAAARAARARLDRVVEGDIEALEPDWGAGAFDCIVCGDVLEHLREPLAFLRRARAWLRIGGRLIASVPNVRHHSVVRGLLAGHWTYQAAGLLDRTHLRFFTRRELEKLLFRAGFRLLETAIVPGAEHAEWVAAGRPGEVRLGGLHVAGLDPAEAEEFHAYQFLVTAEPAPPPEYGLTSVVLVTHNALEYTRRCLEALRLVTDEPYELIAVDNASADGTPDFLGALGGVRLIRNSENRGFPAAANQGVRAAAGRQVLLLNPDTLPATGWLRRLLDALLSAPDVGLVGPCSNGAPGGQRVTDGYRLDELDGFAWDWGRRYAGEREEAEALSGFCLLVRRAVFERVGLLDERFGAGCCEDDDLCLRARRAGFRCLVARDAFVHHFGHRSFAAAGIDQDALYQKNQLLLRRKWERADGLPAGALDTGLTSIVIPAYNGLEHTRRCIESIRRATAEPYELILVDDGSSDGTAEFFRSVPNATVVTNPTNLGFPAAANRGLQAAKGRQVLLLNNDTVVPPGWLGRLLRALHADTAVGLAGPCSNRVSGEQQVPVDYGTDLAGLDQFAERWAAAHAGRAEDTDRLVGFCLLVRREVIEKVGLLDERFGVGNFEDDDYCLRALKAGFRCVIARDAFVHHEGGATFRAAGIDYGALLRHNAGLFRAKWAEPPVMAAPPAPAPAPAAPRFSLRAARGGGLLLEPAAVALSACLIVRDNARTIGPCLESIHPWVDEMVVVDTGSEDDTPALAGRLGARVFHFPWCDDFSAARNESLRHARGDWLFWMDSDDTIDEVNGRGLRRLALGPHDPSVLGYVVQVHCPSADGSEVTVVDHVKLFRNRRGIRFDGRIHEQLLPAIRRAGGEVAWTDLFVVHSGYDHSPEGQERKKERDFRLLHLELAERPGHPFTLFNLGMTHADVGEYDQAVVRLRESIAASDPGDSQVRKAYSLLTNALARSGRLGEALAACDEGLRLYPKDDELRFRKGALLLEAGRAAEAVAAFEGLLASTGERHFTSSAKGLRGHLARQNLAVALTELGAHARAAEEWRRVVAEAPGYRPGWRGLGEALLAAGRVGEAAALADQLLREGPHPPEGAVLAALASAQAEGPAAAEARLAEAAATWPGDRGVLADWARWAFEHSGPAAAERPLERLVGVDPRDAAAWHNLGSARLHRGQYHAAAQAYTESLKLRPGCAATLTELAHVLEGLGRHAEAGAARAEAGRTQSGRDAPAGRNGAG